MDVLNGMRAFRAVASTGSFVAAARTLKVSTAWISKLIAQLEQHLNVALLVRTTRKLALTEAGRLYLPRCEQLLDDLSETESTVRGLQHAPVGRLRITAPMSFGLLRLSGLLPQFCKRYPDVELDVALTDRTVDLVEEQLDLAIRIAEKLEDSTLVVRRIGSGSRVLCAAPSYLRQHGTPTHPHDLRAHQCLRYALHKTPNEWRFRGADGEELKVSVRGPLQINNSVVLRDAAVAGAGILLAPDFIVIDEIAAKRLKPLLTSFQPSSFGVYAVSPPTRFAAAKTRAFVEFLGKELADKTKKRTRS